DGNLLSPYYYELLEQVPKGRGDEYRARRHDRVPTQLKRSGSAAPCARAQLVSSPCRASVRVQHTPAQGGDHVTADALTARPSGPGARVTRSAASARTALEHSASLEDYRLLGGSGLRVSPLALGTMTFGSDWGWGAERKEAQRMFDSYVD